jgi:hypothetical protein
MRNRGLSMRTIVRSGTFAAAAMILSVGLAAQTTPQSGSSSAATTITVTGCIQRAPAGTTATSGTTGATSASETKFVLNHAAAASPASPTGTSGTTPSPSVASTYRLNADDAKLTPHVGHKVEISGTVDAKATMTSPDSSASSSMSSANGPTLKVETVKMIASSCSE